MVWYRSLTILFMLNLLMIGVLLKATWIPGVGCAITETDNKLLAITFIYSMVFDFIVLMLTGYKLFQPAAGRSRLVVLIFNDGLVYFAIAFFVNLIATVCIHIHKPPSKELTHHYRSSWLSTSILSCRLLQMSLRRSLRLFVYIPIIFCISMSLT